MPSRLILLILFLNNPQYRKQEETSFQINISNNNTIDPSGSVMLLFLQIWREYKPMRYSFL
jgi:hypothetical protein